MNKFLAVAAPTPGGGTAAADHSPVKCGRHAISQLGINKVEYTDILTVSEEDVCCFVSKGPIFEVINESTN